jgi:hypothetical protein
MCADIKKGWAGQCAGVSSSERAVITGQKYNGAKLRNVERNAASSQGLYLM